MSSDGSITRHIGELRTGPSDVATQKLWQRYFRRVVGLARKRLGDLPRASLDEEDIACMALDSFFRGVRAGRFPWLRGRENVWPLLAAIAARKAINQRHRLHAAKRPDLHVRPMGEMIDDTDRYDHLDAFCEPGLDPPAEVILSEFYQHLYRSLPTDQLRRVLTMKLEGYTNGEIARTLGVSERTIDRKWVLIREHAQRLDADVISEAEVVA